MSDCNAHYTNENIDSVVKNAFKSCVFEGKVSNSLDYSQNMTPEA
jgi:hypothetical protein